MKFRFAVAFALASSIGSAATIYECRAYNGSSFFSSGPCGEHKAVGVYLHTVPDGIPFDQQVRTIEDAKARRSSATQQEDASRNQAAQCAQINSELKALQLKYTSWQHIPVNEVNIDQGRERDLKSQASQYRCHML